MSRQDGRRTTLAVLLDTATLWTHRYVVLSDEQADACALWAAHTHAVEAFRITPYLNPQSAVKQSGKTRLLETLRPLTANPLDTDGTTPAALIRIVNAERPTLLLDEADASFNGSRELAEALRGILNSGFRSRGSYIKCSGEGANLTVNKFSTFCPKAIAGIGKLPDTVADRSIPINLRRRAPGEAVREFIEEEWELQATTIANGFKDALTPELDQLANAKPARPEGISDRAKEAWKPLLAVADLAGGNWPERARKAAQILCGGGDVDEQEIGVRLIAALRAAFDEHGSDRLMSETFLEYLHAQDDEPWADWSRGNPISQSKVARFLRPFEIRSKDIRFGSGTRKGYARDRCEDAFERYLAPAADPERNTRDNGSNKPETAPLRPATREQMLQVENPEKPLEQANVAGVALSDAPTGANWVSEATPEEQERIDRLLSDHPDEGDPDYPPRSQTRKPTAEQMRTWEANGGKGAGR